MRIDKILRDLGALLQPENDRGEVILFVNSNQNSTKIKIGKKTSLKY